MHGRPHLVISCVLPARLYDMHLCVRLRKFEAHKGNTGQGNTACRTEQVKCRDVVMPL